MFNKNGCIGFIQISKQIYYFLLLPVPVRNYSNVFHKGMNNQLNAYAMQFGLLYTDCSILATKCQFNLRQSLHSAECVCNYRRFNFRIRQEVHALKCNYRFVWILWSSRLHYNLLTRVKVNPSITDSLSVTNKKSYSVLCITDISGKSIWTLNLIRVNDSLAHQ